MYAGQKINKNIQQSKQSSVSMGAPAPKPPKKDDEQEEVNNAASNLPQMKGKSQKWIKKELKKNNFDVTQSRKSGNEIYRHRDGSEFRNHPYGNLRKSKYKSSNNAHIHKQNPRGNQLNDRGRISNNPRDTHIGTRNPKDLPKRRNRKHGE